MGRQEILERLRDNLATLDEEGVKEACRDSLEAGIPPYEALMEGLAKGMELVGKKYEEAEFFLAELIVAGEIMKEAMNILHPHQGVASWRGIGKVAIGTVKGDLHDIGKNVVTSMLRGAGFEVIDLGVDVPQEKFVSIIKNERPDIVALSALLTTTLVEIDNTIRAMERDGVRDRVKVIVGGAPVTMEFAEKVGADAFGRNALDGVEKCKAWVAGGTRS